MLESYSTWLILAAYAAAIWLLGRRKASPDQFFGGKSNTGVAPGVLLLGVSGTVSWVMAKSADNTMALSQAFGVWGGIGYATYWLGFISAGIAIYFMRTRGAHPSLSAFLSSKYGMLAARLFLIVIAIRLFNEVWSNTKVTSQYFGAEGSIEYWLAAVAVTIFTVAYSWRGGLRSSLLTDAGQMVIMAGLLAVILVVLGPDVARSNLAAEGTTSAMRLGGITFCLLALTQAFSYPFHDPVLTDRAFVSPPKRMVVSFVLAALLGGGLILLYGTVGLYAITNGIEGKASVAVPAAIGLWASLIFNAVMLTSAGSTLDSTFSSSAKLSARDWRVRRDEPTAGQRRFGRSAMIVIALLGNLPLLSIYLGDKVGPAIIAATTISGTMVMGLAPIMLLAFIRPAGALSFHLALWPGVIIGALRVVEGAANITIFDEFMHLGTGKYAKDLGVNVFGLLLCTTLYLLGAVVMPSRGSESSQL